MSDRVCIYCRARPVGSAEHILQAALGSRTETPSIVCSVCNNGFSSGELQIDTELTDAYKQLVSRLWIFPGRRWSARRSQTPKIVRNVVVVSGETMDLLPGGRLQPQGCATVEVASEHQLHVSAARFKQVRDRIPNIERQYGAKVDNIVAQSTREQIYYTNDMQMAPCGINSYRAILKSAMNLLGFRHHRVAISDELDAARQFILGLSDQFLCVLDMSNPTLELHVPQHYIALSSTWHDNCLLARVCLFGSVWFTGILASPYGGPTVEETFFQDPWDPTATISGTLENVSPIVAFASDDLERSMSAAVTNISVAIEACRAWTETELASTLDVRSIDAAASWEAVDLPQFGGHQP